MISYSRGDNFDDDIVEALSLHLYRSLVGNVTLVASLQRWLQLSFAVASLFY
jgi:hypothetical protein